MHPSHKKLLQAILDNSGKPSKDAFLNNYLGNDHVRYPITTPVLRAIAKEWTRENRSLPADEFNNVITSLVQGKSSTEKILAGILLSYSSKDQRKLVPEIFNKWLDHLIGWAEIDAVCTGNFHVTQFSKQWPQYKKLITSLSKDKNINKRRASLVLFCSPVSKIKDDDIGSTALLMIDRLKGEQPVIITKAISWVLRSMIKLYRNDVQEYLDNNLSSLPKIAIRETRVKLDTGTKGGNRKNRNTSKRKE